MQAYQAKNISDTSGKRFEDGDVWAEVIDKVSEAAHEGKFSVEFDNVPKDNASGIIWAGRRGGYSVFDYHTDGGMYRIVLDWSGTR